MTMTRWLVFPALAALLAFAACCNKDDKTNTPKIKPAEHGHPEEGPHGGALAEWGDDDEYHLEFTVDHKTQEATVYVLDGTGKKTKPIKNKDLTLTLKQTPAVTVKLVAKPDKDDPVGTSSRFVGKHEALGKVQEFQGTIGGELNGEQRVGDFAEKAHAH